MRNFFITACISCLVLTIFAGWAWQRWLDTEVSPTEYAALYSLKRMDAEFFAKEILPELEKLMDDKHLTNRELRSLSTQLSGLGGTTLEALKKTTLDETLSEALQDAQKRGAEAGKSLGDSLGKTLDDISGFIQRKSDELTTPKARPEAPSTF